MATKKLRKIKKVKTRKNKSRKIKSRKIKRGGAQISEANSPSLFSLNGRVQKIIDQINLISKYPSLDEEKKDIINKIQWNLIPNISLYINRSNMSNTEAEGINRNRDFINFYSQLNDLNENLLKLINNIYQKKLGGIVTGPHYTDSNEQLFPLIESMLDDIETNLKKIYR